MIILLFPVSDVVIPFVPCSVIGFVVTEVVPSLNEVLSTEEQT